MTSTNEQQESRRDEDAAPGNAGAAPQGDFVDETVAFWQKRSKRQLTREDGRQIIENLTGFFRILQEWDRAERAARKE
jgi:hypothetical protein